MAPQILVKLALLAICIVGLIACLAILLYTVVISDTIKSELLLGQVILAESGLLTFFSTRVGSIISSLIKDKGEDNAGTNE